MVSFYNDLKFKNTTDGLIFIESFADGNKVTFRIYGFEQTANITRISTVESTECPGYDEVEDIDGSICGEVEEKILVSSKPIIKSKSSLIINENGKTFKRHLSNDTYKGVKGVKAKKSTISHINNE